MQKRLIPAAALALAAALPFVMGQPGPARARLTSGFLAGQAAGRAVLAGDGTLDTFGFFTSIEGPGTQIFSGAPSEKTAHFTFRATGMRMTPLFNAGIFQFTIGPASGAEVLYHVYFNANPNQDFHRPDSFSDGRLIATYKVRSAGLTLIPGVVFQYSGTYEAVSGSEINFREAALNLAAISDAITVTLSGPGIPAAEVTRPGAVPYTASILAVNRQAP